MTTPFPLPAVPNDELVAAAWIASIPGFTPAMTGETLPPDLIDGELAPWLQTGYVTVAVAGGNPDPLMPLHRVVIDVQCWAADPGSNTPPWQAAFALSSAITKATWSTVHIPRKVTPVVNGVTYPAAIVQGAAILTSFRRLYSDPADYATIQGDLWLQWIALDDVIE